MDIKHQLEVIRRGAVELISEEDIVAKLKKGKPLRVKAGFDPTAPDLHLGHTVLLQKMKQIQELGHHVIFLIGDFTAKIGDPSGRSETRPQLSDEEIAKNIKTYESQVFKVLDEKNTEVRFNSEWLGKMSVIEFARLGAKYTVARMLERDDFKKRIEAGTDISVLEFYYPLMQAQDSVVLKADIELGGNDQKFNLLMGRTIQKRSDVEPQVVLTMPLLVGTDGVKKMSKSYGNYVGINESPKEMFGKLMSITDELMWQYYELLSDKSLNEIDELKKGHPKAAKVALAKEIITRYHSAKDADAAEEGFERVFAKKDNPEDMPELVTSTSNLVDVIVEAKLASSKSEVRRLITQGGVSVNDEKVADINATLGGGKEYILKVGKRKFCKIKQKG
ncbi:MAG: tyrosine--tRNA ligase [Deltaproteobacteria bacterium CG11_big_fil_rev_8_21_14_0_20_49_13]|nr:MAG: tyrosine--tRNA ligase [Deltaproteobacteria bacterium CG11_big_fil_rev_8_21_14_0_20_49_13]